MIYIKLETINEDSGRTCVEIADDEVGRLEPITIGIWL
jgi:hypothetical protein